MKFLRYSFLGIFIFNLVSSDSSENSIVYHAYWGESESPSEHLDSVELPVSSYPVTTSFWLKRSKRFIERNQYALDIEKIIKRRCFVLDWPAIVDLYQRLCTYDINLYNEWCNRKGHQKTDPIELDTRDFRIIYPICSASLTPNDANKMNYYLDNYAKIGALLKIIGESRFLSEYSLKSFNGEVTNWNLFPLTTSHKVINVNPWIEVILGNCAAHVKHTKQVDSSLWKIQ